MSKIVFPGIKIAFVKSEYYHDLYASVSNADWRTVVLSSSMRSGPIGLFAYFDTRFFVIKQDDYATDYWKQKVSDCGQGTEQTYAEESLKPIEMLGGLSKADVATSANEIDWSSFEIVIALDACISENVTKRYPRTLWCYYISEGCMCEYSDSRLRPLPGYSVFLNQRFRTEGDYADDPNLTHEIDFPYHLMDDWAVRRLLNTGAQPLKRKGIFIEKDTRGLLSEEHRNTLEQIAPLCEAGGSIRDLLQGMSSCKYFLRLGARNVWGNASIEAVASGLLMVSSTRGYRNRIFGCQATAVSGVEFSEDQFIDAVNKIRFLEENDSRYSAALLMDQIKLRRICMQEPMQALLRLQQKHCTNLEDF